MIVLVWNFFGSFFVKKEHPPAPLLCSRLVHHIDALAPEARGKKGQHRVELQTARQHVKGQQQLGRSGEIRKAAHRADHLKAGTDVVQAGRNGCKRRHQIEPVQREQQHRQRQQQHINVEIVVHTAQRLFVQRFALKADRRHGMAVQHLVQVLPCRLEKDDDARYFQAARRRARACAHKRQDHDHDAGVGRPEVEVRRGVAGGRNDGRHLEERRAQRRADTVVHTRDVRRDRQRRERDDA